MCTIIVLIILASIYVYKSEISIGEKKIELKTADIIPQTTKNI